MRLMVTLAWRNLWRNRRRTLLTASTVGLGLALLLIFLGLNDGMHGQMIEGAVRMGSGHVLFQSQGYQQTGGLERALTADQLDHARSWVEQRSEEFGVQHSLARIFGSALASSADGATGVQVIGVEPTRERLASRFSPAIISGEFLDEDDENLVVLGQGVARKLDVELGERVVLMAQAVGSDQIESRLVRVKGVLQTGLEDLDQLLVLAPLSTAQSFFRLPGRAHHLALILKRENVSQKVAREGAAALTSLEVLDWPRALPELQDYIRVDDGGNYVFNLFLFLLIGFMVLNTLLMSVLERQREFSLMDALGLTPARRFLMILTEAFFVASLSALLGLAVGLPLHFYLNRFGLSLESFNLSDMTAAGVVVDPVLYSELSPARLGQAIGWIFAMTMVLALVAARRAARPGDISLLGRDR